MSRIRNKYAKNFNEVNPRKKSFLKSSSRSSSRSSFGGRGRPKRKNYENIGPSYERTSENDFPILLERFYFTDEFEKSVKDQARKIKDYYEKDLSYYLKDEESLNTSSLWQGREDLTDLTIFTIDGVDAKDFDDAISLEKENENYHLGVHVADVAAFVETDSFIDECASKRTTSVYLIDRVIPMLPQELSNDICSLVEGKIRLTVSVFFIYDHRGILKKTRFCNSIIKSAKRCTYDEVQDFFSGKATLPKKVEQSLSEMKILKEKLSAKRFAEGAISFEDQEQKWIFEGSHVVDLKVKKRNFAEELIEEFMLEANKAVSKEMIFHNVGIFRVHESPLMEKKIILDQLIQKMGKKLPAKGSENPLEKVGENKYHLFLKSIKKETERIFFSKALLTSMQQAHYFYKNKGHYGLAFQNYTHFTSPIRRYSDLVAHRILKELMKNKGQKNVRREKNQKEKQLFFNTAWLKEITKHCSEMERKAVKAEREYHKLKSIRYLDALSPVERNKIFDAFVTGITLRGNVFVRLTKTGVEGMIKNESFSKLLWYNERLLALCDNKKRKVLQIGYALKVQFLRASARDLFIEFIPDEEIFR